MKPHKHAELIKAWADGAEIEWKFKHRTDGFYLMTKDNHPDLWQEDEVEYRIKPSTHPVKELTLSIGEIHAVWAAGKYYELDKNGQVDEIKFTEFAYAILRKAQEK